MNFKQTQSSLLICIAILGFVGLGTAVFLFNQKHEGLIDVDADHVIDAVSLYMAFEEDEGNANKRYLGKIIEVEGKISSIERPSETSVNILMEARENAFGGINCSFTEENLNQISSLRKGDKIKIRGECAGFLMDVSLVRCVWVSS